MPYSAIRHYLQQHAALNDSATLANGLQLAAWSNRNAQVHICHDHPVLSFYTRGGHDTYYRHAHGRQGGGAPGRFCLLPSGWPSAWDIGGELHFVHLYYRTQHLHAIAEQVWDKNPASIELHPEIFNGDPQIAALYRHFLLGHDWHDPANHLQISSSATLLLQHLVRHYSNVGWAAPAVRGRLDSARLRRLYAWIDAHLGEALTLADLAREACLSEYHFARLFKAASGQSPHQYVMQRRLEHAHERIRHSREPLGNIALQCGFASAAHLSRRFRQQYGCTPSQLRHAGGTEEAANH